MNDKKQQPKKEVTYYCEECGQPFAATQGSRRYLCDLCLAKKVRQGRPKKNSVSPLTLDKSKLAEIKNMIPQ